MKTELSNFITIYDNSSAYLSKDMDNAEIKRILKIEKNINIENFLKDRIIAALPAIDDNYIPHFEIKYLKRGLIYKELIDGNFYQDYIDILELLTYLVGNKFSKYITFVSSQWIEIISSLKSYLIINDKPVKQLLGADKYRDRACKAGGLLKYGAKLSLNNCELIIENLDGVYRFITSRIKKIGGKRFIEALLSTLKYCHEFDRYIIFKRGNNPIQDKVDLWKPYNYLIILGFRYIKEEGKMYKTIDRDLDEIIRVSTDICFVLFPVQQYSI